MKIISNFTDYYDKLLGLGIDDKIVFNRISAINTNINTYNVSEFEQAFNKPASELVTNMRAEIQGTGDTKIKRFLYYEMGAFRNAPNLIGENEYELHRIYAIINSQVFTTYMLTKKNGTKNIIIKKNITDAQAIEFMLNHSVRTKYSRLQGSKTAEQLIQTIENHHKTNIKLLSFKSKKITCNNKILTDLHKTLDAPIYFILEDKWHTHNKYKYAVIKNIPLHYFGLTNVFNNNVELLYQEISYCIGNIIQNKNEPPIKISDKIKLEQAGFDNITSFRKM